MAGVTPKHSAVLLLPKKSLKLSSLTTSKAILLFSLSFFVILTAYSQQRFLENGNALYRGPDSGYLLDTPTRAKIDLSGEWNYEIEGGDQGTVKVPSAYDFTGKVAFSRLFALAAEQLDTCDFFLVMLGANYRCEITINGDYLINHNGGYTTFNTPIPLHFLLPGAENQIRVSMDNSLDARKTLPVRSGVWGWRNYGGILRDIFILCVPKVSIRTVSITSNVADNLQSVSMSLRVTVDASSRMDTLRQQRVSSLGVFFDVIDKVSGIQIVKSLVVPMTLEAGAIQLLVPSTTMKNPLLWNPDTPDLYLIRCYVARQQGREWNVLDEYDLNFGFRTITIDKGSISFNGRRIVLRGVVWYEEHSTWGSAITYEDMEKDVVHIKNLGANVIRFANHPPHPYMLNLCDRYGLLAMEELPVVAVPASLLMEEDYLETISITADEMILRDMNHPSILAWGLGDNLDVSDHRVRAYVEKIKERCKKIDDRPFYCASQILSSDQTTELMDLAVVNMVGNDLKQFKSQLETWKKSYPTKPVIVGKFGTEVAQGNRNGYNDPLSYEAQARFFLQRLDILKTLDYDGAIVWAFNDWKGDRPSVIIHSNDSWIYSMGLMSYQREKRLAYDAVRSVFRGERFVALPAGSYSANAAILYVVSGLVVLIAVAYFYNSSRRFRDGLHRSIMNGYNFFADIRDQRSVSIVQSTLLGLIVSIATAIVFSSILYHFRSHWVFDNLLSIGLVYDNFKEAAIGIIWNPLKSIGYLTAALFLGLLFVCGVLLALSPIFRTRLFPYQAYTITMWSTVPMLILVPVGMILLRIMESPMYVLPTFGFLLMLFVWVFFRLLKGITVVVDTFRLKVYSVGVFSVVVLAGLVFMYLDYSQSVSVYLQSMYNIVVHSR